MARSDVLRRHGRCGEEGTMRLNIFGMPARGWIARGTPLRRLAALGRSGLVAAVLGCSVLPASAGQAVTAANTTELMRLTQSRSLMLDVADSAQRAVMVGERGHILVSESRSDWRQIEGVPTRSTLTAVAAVGDAVWAVGHDGVILHSADGGLTWAVQRYDPWRPLADDAEFDPRQGVPLLDIIMFDGQSGIAVGAYSLMLKTVDGGKTWEPVSLAGKPVDAPAEEDPAAEPADDDEWGFTDEDLALDEETDPHLNGIARTGDGALIVVGERGAAFRSRDAGATWERVALPYEGSMFGVLGFESQRVLAFGMRGNLFESQDLGSSWQQLDSGTNQTLMGGAALADGGAVLVGGSGAVVHRSAGNVPFTVGTFANEEQETPVLAAVLPLSSTTFVVGGEKGLGRFQAQLAAGE